MSPASSVASSQEALNDTQQTLLTEPDEVPLPTTASYIITSSRREAAREVCLISLHHDLTTDDFLESKNTPPPSSPSKLQGSNQPNQHSYGKAPTAIHKLHQTRCHSHPLHTLNARSRLSLTNKTIHQDPLDLPPRAIRWKDALSNNHNPLFSSIRIQLWRPRSR